MTCLVDQWLDLGYSKKLLQMAFTVVAYSYSSKSAVWPYHQWVVSKHGYWLSSALVPKIPELHTVTYLPFR